MNKSIERSNIVKDYNGNFKITKRDKIMITLIIFIMSSIIFFDIYILTSGVLLNTISRS